MKAAYTTEGPWEVLPEEAHRDYIRVRGTQLGSTYKVANVLVTSDCTNQMIEESRANARLIAAAPELFEALESMMKTADAVIGRNQVKGQLRDDVASLKAAKINAQAAWEKAITAP